MKKINIPFSIVDIVTSTTRNHEHEFVNPVTWTGSLFLGNRRIGKAENSMVKVWYFLLAFTFVAAVFAQEFKKPYAIQLQQKWSKGLLYDQGDNCEFSWKVLDADGKEVSSSVLNENFKDYVLTITHHAKKEENLAPMIIRIPLDMDRYSWKIPEAARAKKYFVSINAIPRVVDDFRASGNTFIYVRGPQESELLPTTFEDNLRVLMDWNGRRGYYKRFTPAKALQRAHYSCQWIRKNEETYRYQDNLQIIEAIEAISTKDLLFYCPAYRASLYIDERLMGCFEEWDAKKKMYVLAIPLPVDTSYAYYIMVEKGNRRYTTYHTHVGISQCLIDQLHQMVDVIISTEDFEFRVALAGKPWILEWKKEHHLELYSGQAHVITVAIKEGKDKEGKEQSLQLRIFMNASHSVQLQLRKIGSSYFLYQGKSEYPFIGNEVNLLRFE